MHLRRQTQLVPGVEAATLMERVYAHVRRRMSRSWKRWKLSPMDLYSRTKWEDYSKAKDTMMGATATEKSPWWIVPSTNKKEARLNCISHILGTPAAGCPSPAPRRRFVPSLSRRCSRAAARAGRARKGLGVLTQYPLAVCAGGCVAASIDFIPQDEFEDITLPSRGPTSGYIRNVAVDNVTQVSGGRIRSPTTVQYALTKVSDTLLREA